ncbi:probable G-protein coupled receptor 158 isoform X2 [Cimex lectularius]|uniref:G-protein coupled receptors family 3 profile domain-containing protein n=1 Tax=Cimex lectularius TaxID=79782 RepID=A0A8I6STT7_CIMLE|nr:probable G-protein coupled receptor 158 isoform X2 [Cimex lectularius]
MLWGVVVLLFSCTLSTEGEGEDCETKELPTISLQADRLSSRVLDSATAFDQNAKPHKEWAQSLLSTDPEPVSVLFRIGSDPAKVHYRGGGANSTSQAYLNSLHKLNATNPTAGSWTHPFFDCSLRLWVFGYVSPLSENRGVVGLYYPLARAELDQCNDDLMPALPGGPRCDPLSTTCVPLRGYGTERGGFRCNCLPGHSPMNLSREDLYSDWAPNDGNVYRCVPNCAYDSSCLAEPRFDLKATVICAQIASMIGTIATGALIFKRRKCKLVAAGMWTILETLLLGILLLYAAMVPLSFEASVETCIIVRWIRELGFIICYGAIILKLYRILIEFRTRKAHRWVVRDKDLLKYLFGMVIVMFTYLAAWTATNINFVEEGFSIVAIGVTEGGEYFQTCKPLWWDYVTQAGEIVFLLFGLHIGLAARNATVQYLELRYLLGAVVIEALISSFYYVAHASLWSTLHPNHAYIIAFIRCHSTSTVVLLLIFAPIMRYDQKPVRDSRHHLTHEPSDAYKPQEAGGGIYSEIDVAEVNLAEMNPEEIRAELKRLYTQLEVLRNKTICQNNPHISKRRGGRKVAHRRFSLQKKGSREKVCTDRLTPLSTGEFI